MVTINVKDISNMVYQNIATSVVSEFPLKILYFVPYNMYTVHISTYNFENSLSQGDLRCNTP